MTAEEAPNSTETEQPPTAEPATPTWPERTARGAAWRGAVVLLFTVVGIPVSAWLSTEFAAYEPRFGSGPPIGLALIVIVLLLGWLRARDAFAVAACWSLLMAGFAGSYLTDKGYVSLHHPYLRGSSLPTVSLSLLALGTAAAVVTVVWGTVSGHRRPRPFKPKTDT